MKNDIYIIDLKIIKHLSSNAKFSSTNLASIILVSPHRIHWKVKKLEDLGVIKNFTINIDYNKLGFSFTSYLGVFLEKAISFYMFVGSLRKIPQITVIDFSTVQFSIFCKVRAIHCSAALDVLKNVHSIKGIRRTETFILMEELLNYKDSLLDSIIVDTNSIL